MKKLFHSYWPYFKFHLLWGKRMSLMVTLFLFVYCLSIISVLFADGRTDINNSNNAGQIMLFVFLIGLPLISVMTNQETKLFFLEFVVSKACSRYRFYFSRLAIFYVILIAPLLLALALTFYKPDKTLNIHPRYHSHVDVLAIRDAFPNSHILKDKDANDEQLLIPNENIFEILWICATSWLAAILVQGFSMISNKTQYLAFIPFAFIMYSCFSNLNAQPFLTFCRWWWLVLPSLLAAFLLVQGLTCWRLRNLEN